MKYSECLVLCLTVDFAISQGLVFPDDERLFAAPKTSQDKSVTRVAGRKSQEKCNEYKALTEKTEFFGSLSLIRTVVTIKRTECDAFSGLVVGGVDAKPNQFPHMAAIGFPEPGGSVSFGCGGSLINEYFVLTAAHCNATFSTKPTFVRLGEHDLSKRSGNERDFEIDEFIQHPEYNIAYKKNDIALIRLKKSVKFNKTSIFPACLYQNENLKQDKAIAIGWGFQSYKGNPADILQKVLLDILPCKSGSVPIYSSQICAGVKDPNGKEKDTCEGDSGGPLQVTTEGNNCVFDIVGVVSFGSRNCGSEPGIYTRVASYLSWIEDVAWP